MADMMDQVGVTFVNAVVNRGIYNNVINLGFGTFLFTPTSDETVDPDLVVSCRLRMDEACATQLHRELGQLLELIAEDRTRKVTGTNDAGVAGADGTSGKDAAPVKPN